MLANLTLSPLLETYLRSLDWITVTAVLVVSGTALLMWFLRYRQNRELARLRSFLRTYRKEGKSPDEISFSSPEVEGVWRTLRVLETGDDQEERSREAFDEAIALGVRLAGAADQEESAAAAVCEVLIGSGTPEIGAAAVVMVSAAGERRVLAASGVPLSRTEASLLMCFDAAMDAEAAGSDCWGYHRPEEEACYDFRVFGLGNSLLVPIREGAMSGGIWVGLRERSRSVSSTRLAFIKALADHAAQSFLAARKAYARTRSSERERDFLLGLSHDLRAPGNRALFAIRGLLLDEQLLPDNSRREQLLLAERAMLEQLELLGDVMEFTASRRGMLTPRITNVRPDEALKDTLARYADDARQKGLGFESEKAPSVALKIDERHLRRVLANLLSNAIKYTDEGVIKVSWQLENAFLNIGVEDSGIGVPGPERRLLFREFARASNVGRVEGIGIGLSLSKALAEANGARLSYSPRIGGGSVFTVSVPVAVCAVREEVNQETLAKRDESARPSLILLLDDDPATGRLHAKYLSELGTIVRATSIEQAREILNTERVGVLVGDYFLGERILTELIPELPEECGLVVVSGASALRVEEAINVPWEFSVLEKPVHAEELCREVEVRLTENRRGSARKVA